MQSEDVSSKFLGANPLFVNRELSWIDFNRRVLNLAKDKTIPLAERLNFITIYGSNLDEFFMIRVGILCDQALRKAEKRENKTNLTAKEQLDAIVPAVCKLQKRCDIVCDKLFETLATNGLHKINLSTLTDIEYEKWKSIFCREILPLLSPQIVDSRHPFPFLRNKGTYVGALLEADRPNEPLFGLVPVSAQYQQFFTLPHLLNPRETCFALTEDLISHFAKYAFGTIKVLSTCIFRVTRNADIKVQSSLPEHEFNYRDLMSKMLKKRRKLAAVRLQFSSVPPVKFAQFLQMQLQLEPEQCFVQSSPLSLDFLNKLTPYLSLARQNQLYYPIYSPVLPAGGQSLYSLVQKRDILLFYPYHSVQPFIQMLYNAAEDPKVSSIQMTLYRVASDSKILESLITAAENGKNVTVILELRARFDEQNNIDWSVRLEQAGCTVVYGFANYKVHSKLTLITRKTEDKTQYITQIGTGNYNEKTNELYTDISFITTNENIGKEVSSVFGNLSLEHLTKKTKTLLVAPLLFKTVLINEIQNEIEHQKASGQGRIIIKCNAISDKNMIEELSAASNAGVSVDMIVRGICCLRAGVEGYSENIRVRSIVGRYLEHARIYTFGEGERQRIYIASGDFLTRNTERRVEVGVRIDSPAAKAMLMQVLCMQLEDNVNAQKMKPNGHYEKVKQKEGQARRSCQIEMYDFLGNRN